MTPLAVDAIGASFLSPSRAAVLAFTVGLLLTFLFVRVNTRLIRANVRWWFHDIESEGGLHVHHMVLGVVVMASTGLAIIAAQPQGLLMQLLAAAFGAGVALTLDEFALILRLQDVYWTEQGRLSVDAVIVAVCVGLLLLLGYRPLGNVTEVGGTGLVADVFIGLMIVLDVVLAVVCLLKGKLWTGFFSVFIPFVGLVGALRVARPHSPWAHRRYGDKPQRMAKARRREERMNRTWRSWRTAFFDVLAGKPHLPDVMTTGRLGTSARRTGGAPPPAGSAPGGAATGDAASREPDGEVKP